MFKNTYLALAFMCGSIIANAQFDEALIREGDRVADQHKGHELTDFRALSLKLTKDLPEEAAKARAIYRWICTNIQNDHKYFKQAERYKTKLGFDSPEYASWSKQKHQVIIDRLIRKKKTVCNGYAYLFRELAFHAGLTAVTINGYSRTSRQNIGASTPVPNHSWNAILIDGKWYYIDTTWGSGYTDQFGAFQFRFNPAHFCTPAEVFAQTHFPMDQQWVIPSGPTSLESYVSQPLVFSTSTKFDLIATSPNLYKTTIEKGELIVFRAHVKSTSFVLPSMIRITLGKEYERMIRVDQKPQEGRLYLTASWSSTISGTYTIDLLTNGVVSCRWIVKVEKPVKNSKANSTDPPSHYRSDLRGYSHQ